MQASNTMTIRELPKTKKMAVDELHPMLKVQKNVQQMRFRNLLLMNNKDWMKLQWSMEVQCPWWWDTKDRSSLNPKECLA